jgi:hypothetical protein
MSPGTIAKLMYATMLTVLLFVSLEEEVKYTGNFFYDTFSGFHDGNIIHLIDAIFSIVTIPLCLFFIKKSEGFAVSHFKNLLLINVLGWVFLFASYDTFVEMDKNSNYQPPLLGFILLTLFLIFVVWRILRGAYLAFNNREI